MANNTFKIKIGTIRRSGQGEAIGVLFGPQGGHDTTFNASSIQELRQRFLKTQGPHANVQFDDPEGYVYLVLVGLYNVADFVAGVGMILTGNKVTGWAAGGYTLTSPVGTAPTYNPSNPAFNGRPTVNFDNTGPEQSLLATSLALAMNGATQFTISYVGTTVDPGASGGVYAAQGGAVDLVFTVNNGGNIQMLWNGVTTNTAIPAATLTPHRIDMVATGADLRIYFDGLLVNTGLQQPAAAATAGKIGYDGVRGLTGDMAQMSFARQALSAAQISAAYQETKRQYGPLQKTDAACSRANEAAPAPFPASPFRERWGHEARLP